MPNLVIFLSYFSIGRVTVYCLPDLQLARQSLYLAEVTHRHRGKKKKRRKKSASSNESSAKGITRPLTGVLVPTLRLKPFSITEISADVALAGLDPTGFQLLGALRVCRFSASAPGHSVRTR